MRFRPRFKGRYKKYHYTRWTPRKVTEHVPDFTIPQELIWKEPGYIPTYPHWRLRHDRQRYLRAKLSQLQGRGTKTMKPYDCPLEYLKEAAKLAPKWVQVIRALKAHGEWSRWIVFIPSLCGHPLVYSDWMLEEQTLMDSYPDKKSFDMVFTIWRGMKERGEDNTWVPMSLSRPTIRNNNRIWDIQHPE